MRGWATPPNAQIVWNEGSLNVEGKSKIIKAQRLTLKETVDGYNDLFEKAMSRHQPRSDEFYHLLSGGRDSRR